MRSSWPVAVALAALATGGASAGTVSFEFGFEERVRSEAWNQIADRDEAQPDQRIQYRFRTRAWMKLDAAGRFEFAAGLDNESRDTVRPEATPFAWDEVVFETLYAGFRAGERFSARVGRQNLMRGEGFVLFDGSALDGSRTAYFNAVDLTWTWPRATLELIAISNPRRDQYLPRVNDNRRPLTEWDEAAVGVYATHSPSKETTLEGYWFHKTERDDVRGPTSAAFQPDRRLHTLGGRVAHRFAGNWSVAGELALQRGAQDPRPGEGAGADIEGWGGYVHARRSFAGPGRPSLSFGYIGLSGDDPGTRDDEGWDPLFSRWPKWSELYIYSLAGERGAAYWTNFGAWQAEFTVTPWAPLALRGTWYRMDAYERVPGARFGRGTRRGDLYQVRADVRFGECLKGHVLWERLEPGGFYAVKDPGYFLRFEVVYHLASKKGGRP